MKTLLLSTVALLGLATAASAADLPRRAAPPVVAPIPVFTWTGFYVGANAGYGFADHDRTLAIPASAGLGFSGTVSGVERGQDGFVGGGQVGYNYQLTPGMGFVIGVEADIQYADFNRTTYGPYVLTGVGVLPGTFSPNGSSIDWFGTVRGRVGYAFDRVLVYGTGGFAYGGGDSGSTFFRNDDTRTGYAAGGGIEYAFTDNLTAKIEGLYVNLERDRNTPVAFVGATPLVVVGNRDEDFAVVRAGVNFKFGSY